MNFHIIVDHPWRESFNFSVAATVIKAIKEKKQNYDLLDLNRDSFNPVMSEKELAIYTEGKSLDPKVEEYQHRLKAADHLIFIFPIWWNVMPAMLKGWMDKVLLPGFAFTTDEIPQPLLTHIKGATVITSTGTADDFHREEFHNALKWSFCEGTLKFCGINDVDWLNFGETGFCKKEKHIEWIEFVNNYMLNLME